MPTWHLVHFFSRFIPCWGLIKGYAKSFGICSRGFWCFCPNFCSLSHWPKMLTVQISFQPNPLLFIYLSIYLKHTKNIFLLFSPRPSLVRQRSCNFCAITQFKLSRVSTRLCVSERQKSLVIQQYHAKTLKNSNLHSVSPLTQSKLHIPVESISCFYGP